MNQSRRICTALREDGAGVVVFSSSRYVVTSFFNGGSFEIRSMEDGKSVLLQGDDAVQFDNEMEAAFNAGKTVDYVADEYSDVMV